MVSVDHLTKGGERGGELLLKIVLSGALLLVLSSFCFAQSEVPVGTILPVEHHPDPRRPSRNCVHDGGF